MANVSLRVQRSHYQSSKQEDSVEDLLKLMRGYTILDLLNSKMEDKLCLVSVKLQNSV